MKTQLLLLILAADHYRFAQFGESGGEVGFVDDVVVWIVVSNHERSYHCRIIGIEYLA